MNLTLVPWQIFPNVVAIMSCVSMHTILSAAKVKHVDLLYWMLKVPSLPAILRSVLVDLNKYHFTVIVVEAQSNAEIMKDLIASHINL